MTTKVLPNTWIELNRDAFVNNFMALSRVVAPAKIMAVVKADGYGLGLTHILSVIQQLPCEWLGVNDVWEAEKVREQGYRGFVLVIGPLQPNHLSLASQLSVHVTLANHKVLSTWLDMTSPPPGHLKCDTGMNRQGFFLEELSDIMGRIKNKSLLHAVTGLMSHLSNESGSIDQQLARLNTAQKICAQYDLKPISHISASHGVLTHPASHLDMVRCGISLYGYWPYSTTKKHLAKEHGHLLQQLTPIIKWKTHIIQIKSIRPGDAIGYQGTYKAKSHMTIAVIAIGYHYGYRIRPTSYGKAHVLVRGQRCPFVGKISMNTATIHLPPVIDFAEGDQVTLIGTSSGDSSSQLNSESLEITLDDLAAWCHTSIFETLTMLHPSIQRILV
ncbi:MAG: alanine racemase [Proteobacteria bacterium]|nr:alanine racemase [Pseudomonadota bacterium]